MAVTISGSTGIDKVVDGSIAAVDLAANAVTTAKIADDAITLAKMAPGTDGNLITYDASQNPAYVATGTAGQLLTSAGTGAPPTFTTVSSGGLTQLASFATTSGTTVASPTLDLSTYKQLIIESWSVSHSTAGYTQLRWSNTGGTFQNTSINGTTNTEGSYGRMYHDLVNKYVWVNTLDRNIAAIDQTFYMGNGEVKVGVNNQVTTSTTSLTFDWASGATFDAGQIIIYGLK
tara:strand:- start:30 stop:725 length:696 start_codon:yes stop_codon:yes gene_type:complete